MTQQPMTPSEQERERAARECAALQVADAYVAPQEFYPTLDAYAAAVRRAVVAEAVAVVEGLRTFGPVETFDGTKMDADNLASWVNRYEVTTALRGLSPEGGV